MEDSSSVPPWPSYRFSKAGHTEGSAELLKEAQPCEMAESKASNGAEQPGW